MLLHSLNQNLHEVLPFKSKILYCWQIFLPINHYWIWIHARLFCKIFSFFDLSITIICLCIWNNLTRGNWIKPIVDKRITNYRFSFNKVCRINFFKLLFFHLNGLRLLLALHFFFSTCQYLFLLLILSVIF